MATEAYTTYRKWEAELRAVRVRNLDVDSPEEEPILEAMDTVWWAMTDAERAVINAEPPTSGLLPNPDA